MHSPVYTGIHYINFKDQFGLINEFTYGNCPQVTKQHPITKQNYIFTNKLLCNYFSKIRYTLTQLFIKVKGKKCLDLST